MLAGCTRRRDAATARLRLGRRRLSPGRCRKPTYAGLRSHRGRIVGPAAWPALVDEGIWRAAQAVLTDPSRRNPGGPRALLTGLALCGVEGCGLTVHSGGGNAAARSYRIYRCRSMTHVNRRAEPVEDFVEAVVVERLSRPDAVDLLTVNDRPDVAALHAEADQLRRRLDALADDLGIDELTLARRVSGTAGASWPRSRPSWPTPAVSTCSGRS